MTEEELKEMMAFLETTAKQPLPARKWGEEADGDREAESISE